MTIIIVRLVVVLEVIRNNEIAHLRSHVSYRIVVRRHFVAVASVRYLHPFVRPFGKTAGNIRVRLDWYEYFPSRLRSWFWNIRYSNTPFHECDRRAAPVTRHPLFSYPLPAFQKLCLIVSRSPFILCRAHPLSCAFSSPFSPVLLYCTVRGRVRLSAVLEVVGAVVLFS